MMEQVETVLTYWIPVWHRLHTRVNTIGYSLFSLSRLPAGPRLPPTSVGGSWLGRATSAGFSRAWHMKARPWSPVVGDYTDK